MTHNDNARVGTGMRVGSIYHFGTKTIFPSVMEKAYLCRVARSRCKRPSKWLNLDEGVEDIGLASQNMVPSASGAEHIPCTVCVAIIS